MDRCAPPSLSLPVSIIPGAFLRPLARPPFRSGALAHSLSRIFIPTHSPTVLHPAPFSL